MSGPRPTPTAILEARGSWRAKTRKKEPKPKGGLPSAPKWLDKAGKEAYRQFVRMAEEMNVGKRPDANVAARYARLWVRWMQNDLHIQKYGETYPIHDKLGKVTCLMPFPQVTNVNKLSVLLLRIEQEFGMTPAARTRIQVDIPEPVEPEGKSRFFKAG